MPEKTDRNKIDFDRSEQYILSIRIDTDGFSFSIYNPIRDSFVLTRQGKVETELSVTANMRKAFKELDFLSYTYKQTDALVASRRFTLMPLDLFAEDRAAAYFYYNFSPKENETLLYDTLPKNGAVILYALDKSLYTFLQEQKPQIRFQSSVSSLAERFAVESRVGTDKKMYVHLHREVIEVYAYERGHLMLLNAYDCNNNDDRVYYLLYTWKQLAMDQQADELCITGSGEDKNQLADEIRRFVRHVTILNPVS
ncbi:MAG: DUF3822 family protein [Mediterranea sp.]|jgi:hypothetical protein|nr:DUF3822 family protein [Mediterranea sp.]